MGALKISGNGVNANFVLEKPETNIGIAVSGETVTAKGQDAVSSGTVSRASGGCRNDGNRGVGMGDLILVRHCADGKDPVVWTGVYDERGKLDWSSAVGIAGDEPRITSWIGRWVNLVPVRTFCTIITNVALDLEDMSYPRRRRSGSRSRCRRRIDCWALLLRLVLSIGLGGVCAGPCSDEQDG